MAAHEVRAIEQRRMEATNGLHHVRVIAHQMRRVTDRLFEEARAGRPSPPPDVGPRIRRTVRDLAGRMIHHHEDGVLGLPGELRMTRDEFGNVMTWAGCGSGYRRRPWGGPMLGCFDPELTPPAFSAGDVGLWTELVKVVVSDTVDRRELLSQPMLAMSVPPAKAKASRTMGGSSRLDPWEPYGTEEDGDDCP